jgi:hypothetical protein
MKRILVLMTVVAIVLVMLAMSVTPVFARGCPLSGPGFAGAVHSEGKCVKGPVAG